MTAKTTQKSSLQVICVVTGCEETFPDEDMTDSDHRQLMAESSDTIYENQNFEPRTPQTPRKFSNTVTLSVGVCAKEVLDLIGVCFFGLVDVWCLDTGVEMTE